jgi:MFS transporter, PAT family, beta-lactamase induction signal transducer AmpG
MDEMAKATIKPSRLRLADFKDRNLLGVFLMAFSSSAPFALMTSILAIWLTQAGIAKSETGIMSLVGIPIAAKIFWAPWLDWFRLGAFSEKWGRRRSLILALHVMLIPLVAASGFIDPKDNLILVFLLILMAMIAGVSIDTLTNALRIASIEPGKVAIGVAMQTLGQRVGMTAAAAAALAVAQYFGWEAAFMVMALLCAAGIFGAFLMTEKQEEKRETHFNFKTYFDPFKELFLRPGIWLLLAWIFFARFGDSLAFTMLFPMLVDLKFTNNEISFAQNAIGIIGLLPGLPIGVWLYNRLGVKKALVVTMLFMGITNLNMVWLAYAGHDVFILNFTMFFESLGGAIGGVVIMSYMSALCNVRYSATQFGVFVALSALSRLVFAAPAGFAVEAFGYPIFFVISMLATIPGLILLWMLTRRDEYFNFTQMPAGASDNDPN